MNASHMRAGPIIAGSILLVVGLAGVMGGGIMESIGDLCGASRCDSDEALMWGVIGNGVFLAGALVGLAGIGLIVAGVVSEKPLRPAANVVVATPPVSTRPCPNCNAEGPRSAKFCAGCGAAIAPVLRA